MLFRSVLLVILVEAGTVTSDPNDKDNEKYIVDLIGRVTTVSIKTLELVSELPVELSFTTPDIEQSYQAD